MKIQQFIGVVSVISMMSLALAGTAAAADVAITTTGPDSTQTVSTSTTSKVETSNTNVVSVLNVNEQQATSGDVLAKDNTSVEGGGSGGAANNSIVKTDVAISNSEPSVPTVVGGDSGTTPGVGSGNTVVMPGLGGGTSTPSTGTSPAQPGRGGSVLGASTVAPGLGGGGILPVTGPIVPVDVSALRAAWHPAAGTSPSSLVRRTSMFTAGMLTTAALLSLIGAVGSVVYARRQERRA